MGLTIEQILHVSNVGDCIFLCTRELVNSSIGCDIFELSFRGCINYQNMYEGKSSLTLIFHRILIFDGEVTRLCAS